MTCEQAQLFISLSLDQELNREDQDALLAHLEQCPACNKDYQDMQELKFELNALPFLPLPDGYHEELVQKLFQNVVPISSPIKKNIQKPHWHWKKYASVAAAFLVVLFAGTSLNRFLQMGGGVNSSSDTAAPQYVATEMPETASVEHSMSAEGETAALPQEELKMDAVTEDTTMTREGTSVAGAPQNTVPQERKTITTLSIDLEVKDFDQTIEQLRQKSGGWGGYTENFSSYIYYIDSSGENSLKQGAITLRVPVSQYSLAYQAVKEMGQVQSENETTTDITLEYNDISGKLNMRRLEESRLLELIENADTIEDLIAIEERLAAVRSDIETYTTSLNTWDSQISFSSISITITETGEQKLSPVDPDFRTRLKNSFISSINHTISGLETLVLQLVSSWSALAIILFIMLVFFWPIRRYIRKKRQENQPPQS